MAGIKSSWADQTLPFLLTSSFFSAKISQSSSKSEASLIFFWVLPLGHLPLEFYFQFP